MKASHIDRARSRHLLKHPNVAEAAEVAAMAAEIERLHARLKREAAGRRTLVAMLEAASEAGSFANEAFCKITNPTITLNVPSVPPDPEAMAAAVGVGIGRAVRSAQAENAKAPKRAP